LTHPVTWDPETGSILEVPPPPWDVYEPIVAGSHIAFFDRALVLNVAANDWFSLNLDEKASKAFELVGTTVVWAGDRLMVWGGYDGCTGEPPKRDLVYELIPDWQSAGRSAALARRAEPQSFATSPWQSVARPPLSRASSPLFAC
jgi:hypothetical protein